MVSNNKIRKITVRFLVLVIVFLLVSASAYSAEYANPNLLVTPDDIEKNKGKWIILDCRDMTTTVDKFAGELKGYNDGHIPGAVTIGGICARVLRMPPNDVVFPDPKDPKKYDTKKYEEILGNAGISNDKTIVVYATKRITDATVGFWILDWLGAKDVRFLNGGIEAWTGAGKKLDTTPTKLPPAKFKANPETMKKRIATTEDVLKIAKGEAKNVQLVDSRTPGEYAGTDVRAKRGGRIPNVTLGNLHYDVAFDKATGKIKSMDELEKLYGKLDKNKRTVPYCQTGTRSTLTYMVFKLMGFKDTANYDDSWIIWGNREDLPLEK